MHVFLDRRDYILVSEVRRGDYGQGGFKLRGDRLFVIRGGGFDVPERHKHQPNRQHRGEEQISYCRRNADSRSRQSEGAGAEDSEHLRAVGEPQNFLRFGYFPPQEVRLFAPGSFVYLGFYAVRLGEDS